MKISKAYILRVGPTLRLIPPDRNTKQMDDFLKEFTVMEIVGIKTIIVDGKQDFCFEVTSGKDKIEYINIKDVEIK